MDVIDIPVKDKDISSPSMLILGRYGERGVTRVNFYISEYVEKYGDGNIAMYYTTSGKDAVKFPLVVERDGNIVTWNVDTDVTRYAGLGYATLMLIDEDKLKKSFSFPCMVLMSADSNVSPTEEYEDWIVKATELYNHLLSIGADEESIKRIVFEKTPEAVEKYFEEHPVKILSEDDVRTIVASYHFIEDVSDKADKESVYTREDANKTFVTLTELLNYATKDMIPNAYTKSESDKKYATQSSLNSAVNNLSASISNRYTKNDADNKFVSKTTFNNFSASTTNNFYEIASAIGNTYTKAEVEDIIRQMMAQGVSPEQIASAIEQYLATHPIEGLTRDDVIAIIDENVKDKVTFNISNLNFLDMTANSTMTYDEICSKVNDGYVVCANVNGDTTYNVSVSTNRVSVVLVDNSAITTYKIEKTGGENVTITRNNLAETSNRVATLETDSSAIKGNLLHFVSSIELSGNTLILKNEQGTQLGTVTLPQSGGSDWTEAQIKSLIEGYGYALASDIPTESDINSLIDTKLTPLENLSSQLVSMTEDTLGVM